ncbi:hypothetical protein KHA80_14965 [Anaerobacillus sp. HL2]|nr:hypothetical protein KHA80_14965 [Anaerobacillus sp. HL2]
MGVSIAAPIYNVLEENELHSLVDEVTFLPWKNPDELRSRIVVVKLKFPLFLQT